MNLELLDHLPDRRNAGNRVTRKLIAEGDGANESITDKDRTSAHPLEDAGVVHSITNQPTQYRRLTRIGKPLQHSKDLEVERLRFSANEYRVSNRLHSRPQFIDRKESGIGTWRAGLCHHTV